MGTPKTQTLHVWNIYCNAYLDPFSTTPMEVYKYGPYSVPIVVFGVWVF